MAIPLFTSFLHVFFKETHFTQVYTFFPGQRGQHLHDLVNFTSMESEALAL